MTPRSTCSPRRWSSRPSATPRGCSSTAPRWSAPDADPLDAVVGAIGECDDGIQPNRGSLIATFALLLEAARRPALQQISQRWTEAYLLTLSRLLERAGSASPRADAELLIGATDGLLLEQLASGRTENLNPRLRRLAAALVAASA